MQRNVCAQQQNKKRRNQGMASGKACKYHKGANFQKRNQKLRLGASKKLNFAAIHFQGMVSRVCILLSSIFVALSRKFLKMQPQGWRLALFPKPDPSNSVSHSSFPRFSKLSISKIQEFQKSHSQNIFCIFSSFL